MSRGHSHLVDLSRGAPRDFGQDQPSDHHRYGSRSGEAGMSVNPVPYHGGAYKKPVLTFQ